MFFTFVFIFCEVVEATSTAFITSALVECTITAIISDDIRNLTLYEGM